MLGYFPLSLGPISGAAPLSGNPGDVTAPTFTGILGESHSSTSITVSWAATTSLDNIAVLRHEYRIGGAGGYTPATSQEEVSREHTFTGLAAGTQYLIEARCVDTSNNLSAPLSITVSTTAVDDGTMNYIRYSLVTHTVEQHVNLVNLRYALFSQLSPANFSAPVAKGTISMISGPAALNIAVSKTAAPAGWYMLILSDADNTTTVAVPVLVTA